ncbi:MAG: hypothetical protein HQK87_03455 [Nitrospinae bacterium]|nr:hypothetical protein [Nitrospinota bacterium]
MELTQSDSTLAVPWVHGVGDVDSPTIQITGAVQGDGSFEMTGSGATGSNLFTMTFDGTVGGGRWSGEYTLGWQKGSIQCQYIYLFEGVRI